MTRRLATAWLLLVALAPFVGGGTVRATGPGDTDTALAKRIERLVDTFLTSHDEGQNASVLSDARTIFEQEGVPGVSKVGDAAAYGFVLVNVLGQPPDFRSRFLARVRNAATRRDLPKDAVAFAEARRRQTEIEEHYRAGTPSHPELRDQISRLLEGDQVFRVKEGFDLERMAEADRRTAGPLRAIFDRYGVPTYKMVGTQAANDFVVMVQHQSPEFLLAVLPKLKANVDAGQADPGTYAMAYDRTRRDHGREQLYGHQFECASGKALELAPIEDVKNVNLRRAKLGLMRVELYARVVRAISPDMCRAVGSDAVESAKEKGSRRSP